MKRSPRPRPIVKKSKQDPNRQYTNTRTGHYYQPARKPNIIKLQPKAPGLGNQPQFQERDILISKKTLQFLDKVDTFDKLQRLEKYKKALKKVHFVKIHDGTILYMFDGLDRFIEEKSVELNYILDDDFNVWEYYLEKNRNFNKIEEKKEVESTTEPKAENKK